MASAILRGMTKSGSFSGDTLYGFDTAAACVKANQESCNIIPLPSAAEVASNADIIVLAVKPQILPDVLPILAPVITEDKLVVSIAAGMETAYYESYLSPGVPVVRVMPNINAKVAAAASAVCKGKAATDTHIAKTRAIFETVGSVVEIPEKQFPAFCALSGASVAFIYLYIDALARAGVKSGFNKAMALDIAANVALGSAKLVLESGEHPMALVDQVCSPAGTTIEGVLTLQKLGFESAVHQAIDAMIKTGSGNQQRIIIKGQGKSLVLFIRK